MLNIASLDTMSIQEVVYLGSDLVLCIDDLFWGFSSISSPSSDHELL